MYNTIQRQKDKLTKKSLVSEFFWTTLYSVQPLTFMGGNSIIQCNNNAFMQIVTNATQIESSFRRAFLEMSFCYVGC